MPTPDEIRERRFTVAMPGYDLEEVREFVDEMATLVEEGPSVPRSERFPEIGAAATRVLEAADAAAGELVAHGERRAEELEADARQRSEALVRSAEARAEELIADAQRRLDEAEAARRHAEAQAQDAVRRRREVEQAHRRSVELVRRAGEDVQGLLREAAGPRRALVTALEETRSLLEEGFGEAVRGTEDRFDRVEEVAVELEAELDLPVAKPRRPSPRSGEGQGRAPHSSAARGRPPGGAR